MYIFNTLAADLNNIKKSKSFAQDLRLLQISFDLDMEIIFSKPIKLKNEQIKRFSEQDGLLDSIKTCLNNFNFLLYRILLNSLIQPEFLQNYINQIHEIIET